MASTLPDPSKNASSRNSKKGRQKVSIQAFLERLNVQKQSKASIKNVAPIFGKISRITRQATPNRSPGKPCGVAKSRVDENIRLHGAIIQKRDDVAIEQSKIINRTKCEEPPESARVVVHERGAKAWKLHEDISDPGKSNHLSSKQLESIVCCRQPESKPQENNDSLCKKKPDHPLSDDFKESTTTYITNLQEASHAQLESHLSSLLHSIETPMVINSNPNHQFAISSPTQSRQPTNSLALSSELHDLLASLPSALSAHKLTVRKVSAPPDQIISTTLGAEYDAFVLKISKGQKNAETLEKRYERVIGELWIIAKEVGGRPRVNEGAVERVDELNDGEESKGKQSSSDKEEGIRQDANRLRAEIKKAIKEAETEMAKEKGKMKDRRKKLLKELLVVRDMI
jgi:hypothetical protein